MASITSLAFGGHYKVKSGFLKHRHRDTTTVDLITEMGLAGRICWSKGWCQTACDFSMLLRATLDLKLMTYFQDFLFTVLGVRLAVGN